MGIRQEFAWGRGWWFALSASPTPLSLTSLGGSSSRVGTELKCGLPSTISSPTRGTRPTGPPATSGLFGSEWRLWTTNSPCLPIVVLPWKTGPHPSWDTVAVLWGWVTVRGLGGRVFTAPRGMVIETDAGVAVQLTAEPLTTHVMVAILHSGAERPQPWRDAIAKVIWRNMPILRDAIWSGGARQRLLGALPWLPDCGNASPPPAEVRGTLECLYATRDKPGPRHHFLVAGDPAAELSDEVVALVADVAQYLIPHAMMLPRGGREGQQHSRTPAVLLIAKYFQLGGWEAVYLDGLETPSMRHWIAHHLVAPITRLAVDSLGQSTVAGSPPQWPRTSDMAVQTARMACRGTRAAWPGAENLFATAQAAQVMQPDSYTKDCGVCALMSAIGTLLRVPRKDNHLSTLDRRWVAGVVFNRDMGPLARLLSLGELPAAVLDAYLAPRTPTNWGCRGRACGTPCCIWLSAERGMSMLMTVSLQHVKDATQQQQRSAPQPWEEKARRWLQVDGVPPTHALGEADMGKVAVLEGAEYWVVVKVDKGGLEWLVVPPTSSRGGSPRARPATGSSGSASGPWA